MRVRVTNWGDEASARICIAMNINPDKRRQDEILATLPFVWDSPTNKGARRFQEGITLGGGVATLEG